MRRNLKTCLKTSLKDKPAFIYKLTYTEDGDIKEV
jgi:hypothetical protein